MPTSPTLSKLRIAASDPDWSAQLRDAISNVDELLEYVELDHSQLDIDPGNAFRCRVPRAYADKIKKGDPKDPLLLQVLPLQAENSEQGLTDPVSDLAAMTSSGVLQKYHGRALLITTGACAVHCRYCFRRHYPYAEAGCGNHGLEAGLQQLQQDPELEEIILSGGDPLVLDDTKLNSIITSIRSVPQVRYLRIHTRLPVVLPDRISEDLVNLLSGSGLRTTMVIHANHANEIGPRESRALAHLADAGISLFNQSVLLRGVNDKAETLAALSKRLFDNHVTPYYLHLLDPVRGAMHFDVPESEARHIVQKMLSSLPGYLVPKLVREIPDSPSKTTISPY